VQRLNVGFRAGKRNPSTAQETPRDRHDPERPLPAVERPKAEACQAEERLEQPEGARAQHGGQSIAPVASAQLVHHNGLQYGNFDGF
jgi:hypothetical protein